MGWNVANVKMTPIAEERVSKTLSYLLRHGARDQQLKMTEHGWCEFYDVLCALRRIVKRNTSAQELQWVVERNTKSRFGLVYDNPTSPAIINAKQMFGDSMIVGLEGAPSGSRDLADRRPVRQKEAPLFIYAKQGHSDGVAQGVLIRAGTPVAFADVPVALYHVTKSTNLMGILKFLSLIHI